MTSICCLLLQTDCTTLPNLSDCLFFAKQLFRMTSLLSRQSSVTSAFVVVLFECMMRDRWVESKLSRFKFNIYACADKTNARMVHQCCTNIAKVEQILHTNICAHTNPRGRTPCAMCICFIWRQGAKLVVSIPKQCKMLSWYNVQLSRYILHLGINTSPHFSRYASLHTDLWHGLNSGEVV